jgi:glycine hydroxymethyltransferase
MKYLKKTDPQIYAAIKHEIRRQEENLELIASENFTSLSVLEAQGSVLTNKYAEGYPRRRWYGGCEYVDDSEQLAIDRCRTLFAADYANVQPHSGSQANMAVFMSALELGDTVLAMDLSAGGHLTHGHPQNFSGMLYKIVGYKVNRATEQLDFDEIRSLAREHKPKMILAGASAYPRTMDFKAFRAVCDEVGAVLFVDMAHIAGLVAAGEHPSPVPYAEFVSSTTHKTLRGPRGGFILAKADYAKKIDSRVFPGIQGGPLEHVIAGKAVAFKEAMTPAFKAYQRQIVKNAKVLAEALAHKGFRIVSGGTDNHLMLVEVTGRGVTGKEASRILGEAGITVNKNLIPFDTLGPMVTSGIRLGTPAVTTRKMKEPQMRLIARLISDALDARENVGKLAEIKREVFALTKKFPLYPELARA